MWTNMLHTLVSVTHTHTLTRCSWHTSHVVGAGYHCSFHAYTRTCNKTYVLLYIRSPNHSVTHTQVTYDQSSRHKVRVNQVCHVCFTPNSTKRCYHIELSVCRDILKPLRVSNAGVALYAIAYLVMVSYICVVHTLRWDHIICIHRECITIHNWCVSQSLPGHPVEQRSGLWLGGGSSLQKRSMTKPKVPADGTFNRPHTHTRM